MNRVCAIFTGILALASCSAAAGSLSDITFRIRYADGRLEERRAKAETLPNGDARARFRTIDMTDDMTAIDVLSDAAVVPKCDGYWTLGDCRWGRFSADYSRVVRYLETDGRADGPDAARVVAAARRMVPLMDAESATALAISKGHARYRLQRMIRELAARGFASGSGEWTVPSWKMFLGSTAEYYRDVDDADAIDGRAVDFTPKYASSGLQLDFAKVRPTPAKGKLDVRIHMKVAKRAGVPGDAVVFRGMIDRGDVGRPVMEFSVRARDVKADGYAWYDIGSVDFDPSFRFWAGPSLHKGGPASDAVRFDAIRFVKPEGTVVYRFGN